MENINNNEKVFTVTLTWYEKYMATINVKGEDLDKIKEKVEKNSSEYVDYCINSGDTELLEMEYETIKVASIKEAENYLPIDIIEDEEIGID